MENRNRVLLFFALSMGLLYLSRWLMPTPPQLEKKATAPQPTVTAPAIAPAPSGPGPLPSALAEVPRDDIQAEGAEPDCVFDKGLYVATFSNIGGHLKSYRLKDFHDSHGGGVELVNAKAAPETGWPLALDSGDPARNARLAAAKFKGRCDGSTVVYEWSSGGLYARKEVKLDENSYTFSIETRLAQDGKLIPHWIQWPGGFGDNEVSGGGIMCWVGWSSCDDTKRSAVNDITPVPAPDAAEPTTKFERFQPEAGTAEKAEAGKKAVPPVGPVAERTSKRVGMEDQFFLLMLSLPTSSVSRFAKTTVDSDTHPVGLIGLSVAMPGGAVRVYAGPKDKAILEKTDKKLGEIVNLGMFWFITVPLSKALMWLHGYIGNYGWSIVLLTLGINLGLLPLRLKQQISMQKMAKIQPQMKALNDKMKKVKSGDPRKNEIQAEIMELYQKNGVNPLGGCLPLLLQLPFLLGFYNVLSTSIELRGAPWTLWIHDLSARDPYLVMPISMAVSMFLMQKMTPSPAGADPTQQRMMAVMPLVMGFAFLSYPSGLMVYWLTSNVIGIVQQVFISKHWSVSPAK